MNWLRRLFNLDKIEELNIQIKELGILMDKIELEREKAIKENIELKKLVIVNPKEIETNNKYPKSDVTYIRQEKDQQYTIDVRNFIQKYDAYLPIVKGETDDEKALNGLIWVIDNIRYVQDKTSYNLPEYWAYAYQTYLRHLGDCEDGAILLHNMLLRSGVPYWKLRLTAGNTPYGGHAYLNYFYEEGNKWVTLDWCYFPTKLPIKDRPDYKEDKLYNDVWFSWNEKYCFSLNGTSLSIGKNGKK